jgi:hypothetical protein
MARCRRFLAAAFGILRCGTLERETCRQCGDDHDRERQRFGDTEPHLRANLLFS